MELKESNIFSHLVLKNRNLRLNKIQQSAREGKREREDRKIRAEERGGRKET